MPDPADLRKAVKVVWLILSVVGMLAVVAPVVLPEQAVLGLFPVCSAKARGSSCVLCGMTTAFVRLAHGDWRGAVDANPGAPALYVTFALNFLAAAAYSLTRTFGEQRTCNSSH